MLYDELKTGVEDIPKGQGQTQLSPHPQPAILKMPHPGTSPTQKILTKPHTASKIICFCPAIYKNHCFCEREQIII